MAAYRFRWVSEGSRDCKGSMRRRLSNFSAQRCCDTLYCVVHVILSKATPSHSGNMKNSIALLALFLVGAVEPRFATAQRSERVQDGPAIDTVETAEIHSMLTAQRDAEVKAKAAGEDPPVARFVVVDVRTDTETE